MSEQQLMIFEDIYYAVLAIPEEYRVEYKIYVLEGFSGPDGSPLFHRKDSRVSPDSVETIEEADIYAHGSVKWDGCSNWYFDEQDRCMLHGCDRYHLTNLGEVLARCWDMTKDLCPAWLE